MQKRIGLLWISFLISQFSIAQLMINEFSSGAAGSENEYYELVVTGAPGTMQDIRGWILDDHGGHFGCGTGNGITKGHVRFAQIAQWSCIPVGTMIVIYNPNDPHPLLPADDSTDVNEDGVFVLPITNSLLEIYRNAPNHITCNNYTTYNIGSNPLNWNVIDMDSTSDVAAVINPANYITPVHQVAFGSLSGIPPLIYFPTIAGGNTNFSFTGNVSNNFQAIANWTVSSPNTADTPGAPNNVSNQIWLDSLTSPINADLLTGCVPMTVNFSTTSSNASHTYSWNFGGGATGTGTNISHTFTSVGIIDVILDVVHPNGCSSSDTVSIEVLPAVTASFNALPDVCESASAINLTGASPAGGTYSGTGVTGNVFDPNIAGPGVHPITYTLTGVCPATAIETIYVEAIPSISIPPIPDQCESGSIFPLTASPSGGIFLGTGVVGSDFDPILAGAGTHQIMYTASGVCSAVDTAEIKVDTVPNVSLTAIASTCTSSSPISLSGNPSGGVFSGNGISGNFFSPSNAGAGNHTISYSVSNGACIGNANQTAQVLTVPQVSLTPFADECISTPTVNLSGGTPLGGSYTGIGVSTGQLTPSLVGAGTHFITYTYSNGVCSSSASSPITIVPIPNVQFSIPSIECISAAPISLNNGIPTGGTYTGVGVIGNSFDPSAVAVGNHDIIYTVSGTCTASDTQTISIAPQPNVSLSTLNNVCQNQAPITLSNGSPVGGMYSGSGVFNGLFNPSISGAGSHSITYSLSIGSCIDSQSVTVQVDSLYQSQITTSTPICESSPAFPLSLGSPSGGTYYVNNLPQTNFQPNNLGAGTHQIEYIYTNNTCSDTAFGSITVDPIPTIQFQPLSAICENSSSIAINTATPIGGNYFGTGVSGNFFDPTATGVGLQTVYYQYTDGACTIVDSQTVDVIPAPQAQFPLPDEICLNEGSYLLQTGIPAGGIYQGNGLSGQYINLTQLSAGTTSYQYIVSKGGCSDTAIATTVLLEEASGTITSGQSLPICDGEIVSLEATKGFHYLWNTGHTAQFIITDSSGTFNCYIYNQCGGMTDSIEVNVLPVPRVNITTDSAIICKGDSLLLEANSNVGLIWSTGDSSNVIFALESSQYLVASSNICGIAEDSIMVDVKEVVASYEYEHDAFSAPYELSFYNTSQGANEFIWRFGDLNSSEEINPTHIYSDLNNYLVTLVATDEWGCEDRYSESIDIRLPTRVYIPTAFTPNGDGNNDVYSISAAFHSLFTGAIFDRWGNNIFNFNDASDSWDGTIDGQLAAPGNYVYHFVIDGETYSGKLILIR